MFEKGTPRPKKYTVLMAYPPEEVTEGIQGTDIETFHIWVTALDPKAAIIAAGKEANEMNGSEFEMIPLCVHRGHLIDFCTGEGIEK